MKHKSRTMILRDLIEIQKLVLNGKSMLEASESKHNVIPILNKASIMLSDDIDAI